MKFFPTQIDSYLNCPRKYRYSRDPELRKKYFKASPHLVLGNAVHDALEAFFDLGRVSMSDRTYERLCDLLREAWAGRGTFRRNEWKQKRSREEAFGGDKDEEAAWGKKGLNILYRFFQTQDLTTVPLTAEQFHELRLTDEVTLGGKIDRIDRNEDGSLVVVDYKTGKPPRRRGAGDVAESDLQLAHYAIVVAGKFRGRVARCSYLYLNDELELGYEPTDELLSDKREKIIAHCTRMLADWKRDDELGYDAFAATPNPLCGWCDFREMCEPGQEYLKGREASLDAGELPF